MSLEDIAKAPPGGEPGGAEEGHSLAASDDQENKPNGHDPQADSAPAPGALTHKRIVFLDADGNEVPAVRELAEHALGDVPRRPRENYASLGHLFAPSPYPLPRWGRGIEVRC